MKAGYEYQDHGGEKHHSAVFTDEVVREIWRIRQEEGLGWRRIAQRLNVPGPRVRKVLKGQTWKHLLPDRWWEIKTIPLQKTPATHAQQLLAHVQKMLNDRRAKLRRLLEQPRAMDEEDRGFASRAILRARIQLEQSEAWEKLVLGLDSKLCHTPKAHSGHMDAVSCGCWTRGPRIVCACGAAYNPAEVATFNAFVCYDCGAVVR